LVKNYPTWVTTAQKSLRKRADRIMNARNTIYVYDKNVKHYKNVLLIDDFVWSWSTLNETAKKLKTAWVDMVYGFALVGNLDLSYDVINEM
jgi:predicted amidophosphoribosyltransferase